MPSQFAELWSANQALVDAAWGEPVQLQPKATSGGSAFVVRPTDYAQTPRDVVGIFRDTAIVDTVKGSGANTHENIDVLTRRTSVDFDQTLFDDEKPTPDKGWIVIATSQPKLPRYQVVSAEYDGVARVFCKIAFMGYSAT